MTTSNQIPVAEGLFAETADGPRLLGSKCTTCETPYFPKAAICHNPNCNDSKLEDAQFGPNGTLWSYTVQYYPPPPPAKYDEPFEPYALGLIDLPEGLRVLSKVTADDIEAIEVGGAVHLVIEKLHTNAEGKEVVTFKFRQS